MSDRSYDGSLSSYDSMAAVMAWPDDYAPLRIAVVHLLLNDKLCNVEQLVTPLNILGGADGREEVLIVTEKLIRSAFSKAGTDHIALLEDMKIEGSAEKIIRCRMGLQTGSYRNNDRKTIFDIGVYEDEIVAEIGCRKAMPDNHPLNNWSQIRNEIDLLADVRSRLREFLVRQNVANDKRSKSDHKSKKNKRKKQQKRKDPPAETAPPSTIAITPADPTESHAIPAESKRPKAEDVSLSDLENEYNSLAGKLRELRKTIISRRGSLLALKSGNETDSTMNSTNDKAK
eukprot:CAMPEP_0183767956 /NCGR_PEP_ID=MMETSP0739-20130205/12486_1 /TAXON_ID=385413 /ORGANISM="Thalassiosira miniscula, Strain CCMP1093" /LENGTH=286 /DNA_ID=CAMNT_0026006901 /DNA_START=171 /DNA_END=1028 /DNA_ORIENTATION=+